MGLKPGGWPLLCSSIQPRLDGAERVHQRRPELPRLHQRVRYHKLLDGAIAER